MADSQSAQSRHLPDLTRCLNGEECLWTWSRVHRELKTNPRAHHKPSTEFVGDLSSILCAQDVFGAGFGPPSATSKAALEAKTSAINVTPQSTRFDIGEVKNDALWLAKLVELDELSSLHIVIQERQSRARASLLGPLSRHEAAGLVEACGQSRAVSIVGSDINTIENAFAAQESRRARMLAIYINERVSLWRCLQTVIDTGIKQARASGSLSTSLQAAASPASADAASSHIARLYMEEGARMQRLIQRASENVRLLGQGGSQWSPADGGTPATEEAWAHGLLTEIVHIFQTIVLILSNRSRQDVGTRDGIPSSQHTLAWFEMIRDTGLVEILNSPNEALQPVAQVLSVLCSTISVAMLDLPYALRHLQLSSPAELFQSSRRTDERTNLQAASYMDDTEAVQKVHEIICLIAAERLPMTGPFILAWTIILQAIRSLNERIVEADSDDAPEAQAISNIQTLVGALFAGDGDLVDALASISIDQIGTLQVLEKYCEELGRGDGAKMPASVAIALRNEVLELLTFAYTGVGFRAELLSAMLAASGAYESYWDLPKLWRQQDSSHDIDQDPTCWLWLEQLDPQQESTDHGMALRKEIFDLVTKRAPFEYQPFLQLLRVIAFGKKGFPKEVERGLLGVLLESQGFTERLRDDFTDYKTINEELGANAIELTRALQLFEPYSRNGFIGASHRLPAPNDVVLHNSDRDLCIGQGTRGVMVSEEPPRIAHWHFNHCSLKFYGKMLECSLSNSDHFYVFSDYVERGMVVETIDLFATVLHGIANSSAQHGRRAHGIYEMLENAGEGLAPNTDILAVVWEIFEMEVQAQASGSRENADVELLCACTHFLHALLPTYAGRIWSLLHRSDLLGIERGIAKLSTIINTIEVPSKKFDFLICYVKLYKALIGDYVENSVRRKCSTKSSNRFEDRVIRGDGVSDKVSSSVLSTMTTYFLDVFEVLPDWTVADPVQRFVLNDSLSRSFTLILDTVYGIHGSLDASTPRYDPATEDGPGLPKGLHLGTIREQHFLSALVSSAQLIITAFLSPATSFTGYLNMISSLFDSAQILPYTVASTPQPQLEQTCALLAFSATLLLANQHLDITATIAHDVFLRISPVICRLYAINEAYRIPVLSTLEALIKSVSKQSSDPPSILGYLGMHVIQPFLELLRNFDEDSVGSDLPAARWQFLTTALAGHQMSMAQLILAGNGSRKHGRPGRAVKPDPAQLVPWLKLAYARASRILDIPHEEVLTVLQFVLAAQNFWPWSITDDPDREAFIDNTAQNLPKLFAQVPPNSTANQRTVSAQTSQLGSYMAQILTLHLFRCRELNTPISVQNIIASWKNNDFIEKALELRSLSDNLTGRLRVNLTSRYPGFELDILRKTSLHTRQLGENYCYDLAVADMLLQHEPAWHGRNGRMDNIRDDLAMVNSSLSQIDAEVAMLSAFKALTFELSHDMKDESDAQYLMTQACRRSLLYNVKETRQSFAGVCQTRAEMSLVLLQRLNSVNAATPVLTENLGIIMDTIRYAELSFSGAFASDDVTYYRTLLKLLYIGLNNHISTKAKTNGASTKVSNKISASPLVATVLLVLDQVVLKGFREVAVQLHENLESSSPSDLAILTAILQSCLRVPGVEFVQPAIVSQLVARDTLTTAAALYSWCDRLAVNGDAIYGEATLLFLLELSTLPILAEHLAIDGILGHISTAPITTHLRKGPGVVSAFSESAGYQRCYSIWGRGILPLLLNILVAVGRSIASEAATFLEQFPHLLSQASSAFTVAGTSRTGDRTKECKTKYITLAICSEVHTLSLIYLILEQFRSELQGIQRIPDLAFDAPSVKIDVEYWLGARSLLRDRIIPMGAREAEWARQKVDQSAVKAVTRLEESVVREMMGIWDVLGGGQDS